MSITIEIIEPVNAKHLIEALDEYQKTLYPPESNHLDSIEILSAPNVRFYGAIENEEIIAIGSVKLFEDYGEIKRIFVPVPHRGKRLAQKIMAAIEQELVKNNICASRLETGPESIEAVSLYSKLGYKTRQAFGNYQADPLSVFMEKKL
ncbi:MAG: GNAT family N-acetyltransferase [Kangiellaceae bacterium]|nr:GNAT family N-acetyltransferase [Kangiellaceae bacterium]